MTTYPLTPKTNAQLIPGQFWSIPLSDGRFGSGRVLSVDHDRPVGGRTRFIGAILDWVGEAPPTFEAIAGSAVLAVGNAHVRLVSFGGGAILGERPLEADPIQPPARVRTYLGDCYGVMRAQRPLIPRGTAPPPHLLPTQSAPAPDGRLPPPPRTGT